MPTSKRVSQWFLGGMIGLVCSFAVDSAQGLGMSIVSDSHVAMSMSGSTWGTSIQTGIPDVVAYESVDLTPERGAFGIKHTTPNAYYTVRLQTTSNCLPGHIYKIRLVIPAHADDSKGSVREIVHEETLDTLSPDWGFFYNGYTPRANGAHLRVSVQVLSGLPPPATALAKGKASNGARAGGKQSLEETVTWLRTRLVGQTLTVGTNHFMHENGRAQLPIREVTVANGYLIIEAWEPSWMSARYLINLAKVSPDVALGGTFNNEAGANLILALTPTSQGGLIWQTKTSTTDTAPVQQECSPMSLAFTTDEDLAQRVAKAISHLVHLSGGKKEAF